jgi:regulator of sirC expression with transglutaminase-like and TPR domain
MQSTKLQYGSDLSDLASVEDGEIDLGLAALRLALSEYPWLDLERSLAEIDRLALRAAAHATGSDDAGLMEGLDLALFEEAGYRGNVSSYYDPRNSYLNDVIERRIGIPITLSILYMEVGRRIGLNLMGIGLPGHFLVGHRVNGELMLVDPFSEGAKVDREECERLVDEAFGGINGFHEDMLAPVSNRHILVRMLTNLKGIYARADDLRRAVRAMDRILQLEPTHVGELRDRGIALLQLNEPRRAIRDLEAYLATQPGSGDQEQVLNAVLLARKTLAGWN